MSFLTTLLAVRVVAFDENDRAVVLEPEAWKLDIDEGRRSLRAKNGPISRTFSFDEDLLAVGLTPVEATAWAKTFGRLALTGMATSMLASGKGMGGALLDASLRGTVKETHYKGAFLFRDSSAFGFIASEKQLSRLRSLVAEQYFTNEALAVAERSFQLLERVVLDGDRAVAEFMAKAQNIKDQADAQRQLAQGGPDFQTRDSARREAAHLASESKSTYELARAAVWELKQKEAASLPKGKRSKALMTTDRGEVQRMGTLRFLMWLVLGFLMIFVFTFPLSSMALTSVGLDSGWSGLGGLFIAIAAVVWYVRWLIRKRRGAA